MSRVHVRIIVSVLFLTSLTKGTNADLEPYTLDDFLNGTFKDKGWNGTWISDSVYVVKNYVKDYYKVDVAKNTVELLLRADELGKYKRSSIYPTSDFRYFLLKHNTKAIFRHSTASQYTVYDIENKEYIDLHHKKYLQLAQWIPNTKKLLYVFENNIYYISKISNILHPKQLTTDGVRGIVFNGIPDWVYEEEVLSSGSAIWISPNGRRLVFGTFNDHEVSDYNYLMYGQPGNATFQYPSVVSLKYPKAGTTNPTVSLKYVDLDNEFLQVTELSILPVDIVGPDHILRHVTWANDDTVVAVSLNRVQNLAAIMKCQVESKFCYTMFTSEQTTGWLDIESPTFFNEGAQSFILSSEPEGDDFYMHLSLVNENDVNSRERLTYGKRTILSIYGVDEQNGLVYYLSTVPDRPYQEQVYSFDYKNKIEYCVTCNFHTPDGLCEVSSAIFSKQFSYFTGVCHGPGPKAVHVQNLKTGKFFVWETNDGIYKQLAGKLRPIKKTLRVPLTKDLYATVRLLLPPGLDEQSNETYPLLVNVYAGPGTNRILNRYSSGIENYFVTKRKYVYAYIDGRGSNRHGNEMMFEVYRRLGTVEVQDQIDVTKYLQNEFSYIDRNNTAIWGWSYGGFVTLHALIKDVHNVFKVGVAIAPVTSYLYYDSIYTERFMGLPTPEDNIEGYRDCDILTQVEGLRNKTFYIIHGNADDNVHYQQSMLLAKTLERNDIMFYQQSYPDENHSLHRVKRHLYHTLDDFFYRSLNSRHYKNKVKKSKKQADSEEAIDDERIITPYFK